MTTTPRRVRRLTTRRSGIATVTMTILGFLGTTALAGGLEMLVFQEGNTHLPADVLPDLPIDVLVPGLVLAVVFGIGSLVALFGMWRQPRPAVLRRLEASTGQHWSSSLTLAVGVAFTAWMIMEVLLLGPPWTAGTASEQATAWVLEGIYGGVAVSLLVLPQAPGVRRYLAVVDPTIQSARGRRRPGGPAQVLVAHGSKRGATAGIADVLAHTLRSPGLDVDVLPAARVRDVTPYDAVVVGGALHGGRWHRDARRFVRRHDDALTSRLVWLFSRGPLDDPAGRGDLDPVRQVRRAMDRVGARGHMTFGGAVFDGTSVFVASHMAGDWRDPDHAERWAAHVADAIAWEHGGRRLAMSGQPS